MVTDKQMSDLLFLIKSEVLRQLRINNLADTADASSFDVNSIITSLLDAFAQFFTDKIGLTGAVAVALGINRGRADVFQSARTQIAVYQYSAILDKRVCPICASLDGSVVDFQSYMSAPWQPPIHFNCRCIWVAVLKDQAEIPEITGFPESPGGVDAPTL